MKTITAYIHGELDLGGPMEQAEIYLDVEIDVETSPGDRTTPWDPGTPAEFYISEIRLAPARVGPWGGGVLYLDPTPRDWCITRHGMAILKARVRDALLCETEEKEA